MAVCPLFCGEAVLVRADSIAGGGNYATGPPPGRGCGFAGIANSRRTGMMIPEGQDSSHRNLRRFQSCRHSRIGGIVGGARRRLQPAGQRRRSAGGPLADGPGTGAGRPRRLCVVSGPKTTPSRPPASSSASTRNFSNTRCRRGACGRNLPARSAAGWRTSPGKSPSRRRPISPPNVSRAKQRGALGQRAGGGPGGGGLGPAVPRADATPAKTSLI